MNTLMYINVYIHYTHTLPTTHASKLVACNHFIEDVLGPAATVLRGVHHALDACDR